jgi:poly(hydroxyalkanoate) depolymerase family esterase
MKSQSTELRSAVESPVEAAMNHPVRWLVAEARRRNNVNARWNDIHRWFVSALAAAAVWALAAAPAHAASLQLVPSGWASGVPTYISMYIYVPNTLANPPPIVVASHFCTGSANAMFGSVSSMVSVADQRGFIMIFPQTTNNCWDVGSTKALTRYGGGDPHAIVEMVNYTITKYNADKNRVYALGISSGAMMTQALVGLYPDIFKAGAEFSGVPDGCWAVGYTANNEWSGPCAGGQVTMTAQQWGNLVRAQFPGYTGERARVQLWHGTADMTINYNNMGEAIKEWTNVLGLNATPTMTTQPMTGYTEQIWNNACGFPVLEAWTQANGGHTTPFNAPAVVSFFGLENNGPDMGDLECPDGGTLGSSSSSTTASSSSSSGKSSSSTGASSSGTTGSSSSGGTTGVSSSSSGGAGVGGANGGTGGSGGSRASSGGSAAGGEGVGGSGSNRNEAGCKCRMAPADDGVGAMLLAPIGAALLLLRRRRAHRQVDVHR